MTYQGERASFGLALQALCKSFDFSGRSTRTEFFAYYLATIAVGIVIALPAIVLFEFEVRQWIAEIYGWLSGFPLIALMVRRLHDHGRSGWWVMFPLAAIGFNSAFRLLAVTQGIQDAFELRRAIGHADWLLVLIAIGCIAAIVIEGDREANRFGPNPRLEQAG